MILVVEVAQCRNGRRMELGAYRRSLRRETKNACTASLPSVAGSLRCCRAMAAMYERSFSQVRGRRSRNATNCRKRSTERSCGSEGFSSATRIHHQTPPRPIPPPRPRGGLVQHSKPRQRGAVVTRSGSVQRRHFQNPDHINPRATTLLRDCRLHPWTTFALQCALKY